MHIHFIISLFRMRYILQEVENCLKKSTLCDNVNASSKGLQVSYVHCFIRYCFLNAMPRVERLLTFDLP